MVLNWCSYGVPVNQFLVQIVWQRLPYVKSRSGFNQDLLFVHRNPQLGWGFRKAFSFEPVIKTPFDLLKHLAVWQLQVSNKKSKGGPNGERKELSAHPIEL